MSYAPISLGLLTLTNVDLWYDLETERDQYIGDSVTEVKVVVLGYVSRLEPYLHASI